MSTIGLSATVVVATSAERVWSALTDPAALIRWYAPGCRWDFDSLEVGSPVRFFNSDTEVQSATIAAALPMRRFSLLWHPEPTLPDSTLLTTYDLSPTVDGTIVTLTHSGYESVPDAQRAEWIAADEGAVPAIVAALGTFLSTTG